VGLDRGAFAFYRGDQAGAGYHGCHLYTLTYLPELCALGTFRYARECKWLAADLARQWVRALAPASGRRDTLAAVSA